MKRTRALPKPDREFVLSAAKLTNAEARFLVSNYYAEQEARKREDMQLRHLGDNAEQRMTMLQYSATCHAELERFVFSALEKYAEGNHIGQWMLAQYGVGPVIAAGLLAHLDIDRAPTAGHFWSFAGLNPEMKWEKGEKRPYCAQMKQLTYHIGECFKRTSKAADSYYGAIYAERKKLLVARNEKGHNAERAKTFVAKSAEWKKVLKDGKLPDGNLDRQACNYAAKIFLSHLHAVMHFDKFKHVPKPFAHALLGHVHLNAVPMAEKFFPGFEAAYYGRPLAEAAE